MGFPPAGESLGIDFSWQKDFDRPKFRVFFDKVLQRTKGHSESFGNASEAFDFLSPEQSATRRRRRLKINWQHVSCVLTVYPCNELPDIGKPAEK